MLPLFNREGVRCHPKDRPRRGNQLGEGGNEAVTSCRKAPLFKSLKEITDIHRLRGLGKNLDRVPDTRSGSILPQTLWPRRPGARFLDGSDSSDFLESSAESRIQN